MVTVYSTPTCAPCKVAKMRLERAGVEFTEVDLTQAPKTLADLKVRRQSDVIQTPLFEFKGNLYAIDKLTAIISHAQADG